MHRERPQRGLRSRIRTLVADDEPLARELMSNFVRREPGLDLVGTAASGSETFAAVEASAPDLLLLDIQMPCLDGISVAEQLAALERTPYIIFVTAHDSFAIRAFEVAVRDYLVKPVSKRRFAAAIQRARDAILDTSPGTAGDDMTGIVVKSGDALVNLLPGDIVWVAAANQYARIHTVGGAQFVVSQSLRQFALGLPGQSFLRVHRSTLVNQDYVTGVASSGGRYRVEMQGGSTHFVARNRKALLPTLLAAARENARR